MNKLTADFTNALHLLEKASDIDGIAALLYEKKHFF